MSSFHKVALLGAAGATITVSALVAGQLAATASSGLSIGNVAQANPRQGVQSNVLAPGLAQTSVAWGNLPLVNPDKAAGITHYGYVTSGGGPLTQDPKEAFKTEPDKNVYLVMGGHHYLFQGHEGGPRGYVTRIDLDQTDPAKRVTLVAGTDADGKNLPTLDGITWDPFTRQLLVTAERHDRNGSPAAGARFRRLRGCPDRQGGQRLGRRGHRRLRGQRGQAAQQLRLPLHSERSRRPRQGREAPGPAGTPS
jgi:hypothetical protein